MDEYENVELEKICRVCLNQKDDLRPLFQGSVAEMLREVASIQVRFICFVFLNVRANKQ